MIQINADSVLGRWGFSVKRFCLFAEMFLKGNGDLAYSAFSVYQKPGKTAKFVKMVDPEQSKEMNQKIARNYLMYSRWYTDEE